MIPIRLSIEGIYSYQQKQEINFEYLSSAELFGIFGATGSGKSSILEAIGFAIYNQTERLNTREPGGMAYHMMNLKSSRLAIDFECWAGAGNATRYRFGVENRRKKDFTKTDTFKRQTYVWGENQWVPIEEAPEQIIGLSYDNFRRCIIIPQGKFEEFLKLGAKDRTEMMLELFNLHKYDLKNPVAKLTSQNNQSITGVESSLAMLAGVTEEVIEVNKTETLALQHQRQEAELILKEKQRQYESAQQLRELFERLTQTQERLAELNAQRPAHEQRKLRLDQYQYAQAKFATTLTEFDRLSKTLAETERSIQQKQEARSSGEAELTKKESTFASTDAIFKERDQMKRKAEELQKVLDLREQQKVLASLTERVKNGRTTLEKEEAAAKQAQKAIEELDAEIQQLEANRPDHGRIMAVRDWFYAQKNLTDNLEREEKARTKILSEIEQGKETKITIAQKIGINIAQHDLSVSKLIEQVTGQQTELKARRDVLEKQRLREELQQELHQLAGDLQPGQPCPLCGATDHPDSRQGGPQSEALVQVKTDLTQLDRHLEEISHYLPNLLRLQEDAKKLGQELREAETTITTIKESLDRHQSQFVWPEFEEDGLAKLELHLAEGKRTEQAISVKKQVRQGHQDSGKRAQTNIENYRPTLDQLNQTLNQTNGALAQGLKALSLVNFEELQPRSDAQVQQDIHSLNNEYESIGKLHQTLQQEIEERKHRLAGLKGEISTLQGQRKDHSGEVARLSIKLDQLLTASPFASRDALREVLALALDMDAEKDEIRRFEREETQAQTSLSDLKAQVAGRSFDLEGFATLQREITALEAQLQEIGQEIGGKISYGKRLAEDFAQKMGFTKQLDALSQRAENLKILEMLFRGNAFVNYVSTVYLQNLCSAANERFLRLNGNSLQLEIDADNNFLVCDMLNGGHTRSVKTLSGGQTFQAALCLALALSDQVQQQASAKQNFFFLDEGFGSQDKASLRTIFHTLKSLRQENRIVGVISHVDELQQEIETHLHIVNDPVKGSVVLESWKK
ncbi:MAG: AAA family ATPase [Bacteroidia bacterium]|nr:AAA family ATPase [Bacteroidia bacterium]